MKISESFFGMSLLVGVGLCAIYLTLVFAELISLPWHYGLWFLTIPLILPPLLIVILLSVGVCLLALLLLLIPLVLAIGIVVLPFYMIYLIVKTGGEKNEKKRKKE